MRRLLLLALLASPAQAGDFGLGVIVGEPTGISAKAFPDRMHAVDLAVDFSFIDEAFYAHGSYLVHFAGPLKSLPGGDWPVYVGVGPRVKLAKKANVGVRVPVGVSWMPRAPVDVFLELGPSVQVLPETKVRLGGGLGVRYWF